MALDAVLSLPVDSPGFREFFGVFWGAKKRGAAIPKKIGAFAAILLPGDSQIDLERIARPGYNQLSARAREVRWLALPG
jgi:hypothetical protein